MEKVSFDYKLAVRAGLLQALAENGITPSDLYANCQTKTANSLASVLDVGELAKGIVGGAGTLFVDYPLAASVLGGSAAGYGLGHVIGKSMQLPKTEPIEDQKNKELIKELRYHTLINKLKTRNSSMG